MKNTTNKETSKKVNEKKVNEKKTKETSKKVNEKKTNEKKVNEKKTNLLAKVEKDLTDLSISWTVNKKGSHVFKMTDKEGKKYAATIVLFQKENTYRIYCNKKTIDRMALTEKDYTFHPGWSIQYTLNISLKEAVAALQKPLPKQEGSTKDTAPVAA